MSYPRRERLRLLLNAFSSRYGSLSTFDRYLLGADRDMARRTLAIQARRVLNLTVGQTEYALPEGWQKTFAIFVEHFRAYLRWQDQAGIVWYTWVTPNGEFRWDTTVSAGVNIAASLAFIPSWFIWQSPDGTPYTVYPQTWGEFGLAEDATGLTGQGSTETLELRDDLGQPWYPFLTDTPEVQLRRRLSRLRFVVLYDQSGTPWYVYITSTGVLLVYPFPPEGSPINVLPIHWYEWQSPDGTTWKVFVNAVTQQLQVEPMSTVLTGTVSTDIPTWRDVFGRSWGVSVLDNQQLLVEEIS